MDSNNRASLRLSTMDKYEVIDTILGIELALETQLRGDK